MGEGERGEGGDGLGHQPLRHINLAEGDACRQPAPFTRGSNPSIPNLHSSHPHKPSAIATHPPPKTESEIIVHSLSSQACPDQPQSSNFPYPASPKRVSPSCSLSPLLHLASSSFRATTTLSHPLLFVLHPTLSCPPSSAHNSLCVCEIPIEQYPLPLPFSLLSSESCNAECSSIHIHMHESPLRPKPNHATP